MHRPDGIYGFERSAATAAREIVEGCPRGRDVHGRGTNLHRGGGQQGCCPRVAGEQGHEYLAPRRRPRVADPQRQESPLGIDRVEHGIAFPAGRECHLGDRRCRSCPRLPVDADGAQEDREQQGGQNSQVTIPSSDDLDVALAGRRARH